MQSFDGAERESFGIGDGRRHRTSDSDGTAIPNARTDSPAVDDTSLKMAVELTGI